MLLTAALILPGARVLAADGDTDWEIPPDSAYEFSDGLISGLSADYLNSLSPSQRQSWPCRNLWSVLERMHLN